MIYSIQQKQIALRKIELRKIGAMLLAIVFLMGSLAPGVAAQGRGHYYYYPAPSAEAQRRQYYYDHYRYYDRHHHPSKGKNIGIGAAIGAVGGALLGGGKGAIIGAGIGAASGYGLYRYKKHRHHHFW